MNNRCNRQVITSHTPQGLQVCFAWSERDGQGDYSLHTKMLRFSAGMTMHSVNKALSVFVPGGPVELPKAGRVMNTASCECNNSDKFDIVADAQEPEQAFISRYVLEG
jgi:hypothetical protein